MSTDVANCRESQTTEQNDISIIGIGCRFPGATCLSEFWDVLRKGENHITDIPSDRWSADDFYDTDPDSSGKSYTKKAGFINNFADFDHKLFGINGTEAAQMDPQQRQVLECTYMALEDAGITRQQIGGQDVGVYLGSMNSDFSRRIFEDSEVIDQYSVAGISTSVIANRVSYVFNLTGHSMSIDTACSSSLVAIHQAILGLRAGDCSLAICGGVSLMLHPQVFTPLCKAQMLSKTGQCHSFSDAADGYTRGEGCGIVLLKRTDKAVADGNNIWGTVVTGLNQDGHFAQPITAPSQKQQETLLMNVFTTNSVNPATVQYIEAHGTGTKRGDPVEVNAFTSFFSEFQQRKRYIGSVKTNIGHLEPAAGVAGLIKVLLMMKHNTIVPSLHFDKPNELHDFDSIQLTVPTKCIPWTDDVKVACLNSFGFGGANSHAVIKSYNGKRISETSAAAYVICFSGSTRMSLHNSMVDFLSKCDGLDIQSVSYTSTVCREHFKFKKAFVANTIENLKAQVQDFLEDPERREITVSHGKDVIFVFCGMGTAWKGMCKHFMQINKDFKDSIDLIDQSLNRFVPWSLTQRLETSYNIHDPLFGPIAIFSCQVALARLWKTYGVTADTVVGQSIGEVAAAHIAGILPLDEAVKIIYHRTNIMSHAAGGKMLMVRNLNTTTVAEMCKKYKDGLSIALYYSPISCTVSGDADLIEALKKELTSSFGGHSEVQLIDLNVTCAFHSHHMDSCQQNLDASLTDLKTETAKIQMVSSVNPEYSSSDLTSLTYWGENVRQPVRFHDAVKTATKCESPIFIEIGPKPVLKAHLKDIFGENRWPASLSSMFENSTEENFLTSVAFLYEHNIQLEWNSFNKHYLSTTPVPRYSFDHMTFWKLGILTEEAFGGRGKHLFLKQSDTSMQGKITIRPSGFQSVYEHKVDGIIVIPGATYAETGFGLTQLLGRGNPHTSTISVKFFSPVTLKMGQPTDLDVHITNASPHEFDYTITRGDTVHAEGTVITRCELQIEDRLDLKIIKDRCPQYVSGEDVYKMLNQSGFSYGEDFATIDHAFKGEGESLAKLKMSGRLQQETQHTLFHPAVLDGMLQVSAVTFFQNGEFLPIELMDVTLQRRLIPEMIVYTKVSKVVWPQVCFFLCLFAPDGTLLAQVRKFVTKNVVQGNFDEKTATYKKIWMVKDLGNPVEIDKRKVVVVTDSALTETGLSCQLIKLDKVKVDSLESFETILNGAQTIFFLFETPQKPVDGQHLLEELISRINPLRLMILYNVNNDMQIPFTIIMEKRKTIDICGIEAATSCLNEATNAFCRCVLREYKSLNLKSVELFASDRNEFLSRIPTAMDHMLSMTMTSVSEVKLHDDEAHIFALQANVNPAPVYRTTPVNDSAVFCSKSQNAILEPAFFPAKSTTHRGKGDETEFIVSTVVLHSRSLHWITLPPQANFGSSEEQTYPILSMEFGGRTRETEGPSELIACYPTQIMKTINVPRTCILHKRFFPDYQPGYLIMLYTLWCMCTVTYMESVAILYDTDTKPLAEILHILLKSKNIKPILVSVLDVSKNVHKKTLITTVLLTNDITRMLAENWKELRNIICLETITNTRSVGLLTSCHCFSVNILHHFQMFSLPTMLTNVPKMLHWIKAHVKHMEHLVSLLKGCVRSQLMEGVRPIKLTEILLTSELSLLQKGNNSLNMVMKTPSEQLIKASKSYIVVGGLTGLGWECVSYLAVKGAGNVIILNRSQPTEEKQVEMTQLGKKHQCTVVSVQADVSDFRALEECFSKLKSDFLRKPLAGVFFGAAVLCDATLLEMTKEKLKSSLAPKVSGAWNLHLLTADLPLDFFVFHSSVTSIFGNAGQSNYGSGNGFMDELAHCRRRHGLSGQSINWGPLGLGMLNNNPSVTKNLRHQGYDLIEKRNISQCLTHLLMINEPQTIMMRIDRQKMAEHLLKNKETSILMQLKNVLEPFMKSVRGINSAGSKQSINIDQLRTCSYEERLKTLQTYLKQLTCEKALLDEDTFDMKAELKSQGVDSMYAMEISGDIMSDIGVKLSVQEIQLQSGTTLSEYMADKLTRKDTTEMTEEDMELIVTKHEIISSMVQSFFGFNTNHEFRMAYVLVCTVQIPDAADLKSVKELFKKCISLHSLARSTCTFNEETFSLRELSVDDAFDFRCISGTDISEVSRVKKEPINLETHGPLRFIFLTETHELIIIFHKFFFDIRAITIFVSEILNTLKGTSSTKTDTEISVKTDNFKEIQKILASQFPHLLEFWKTRIRSLSNNSFRDQLPKLQHQSRENILITRTLDSDYYRRAMDFVRENRLTFFEYFVSIYQLCLTFVSDSSTSVVTTSFDTRSQVPVLVHSLGRYTNLVPLICELPDYSETVTEFLNRNKVNIQKFLENGIFPFGEIRNLADEDHVDDLTRNYFIFEDDVMTNSHNKLKIEQAVELASNIETVIFIWQKREANIIEIELYLNGHLFEESRGRAILDAFADLLRDTMSHPEATVLSLKSSCTTPSERDLQTRKDETKSSVCSNLCCVM